MVGPAGGRDADLAMESEPTPRLGSERAQELMESIEAVYTTRFTHFVRAASAIVGDEERGRDAVQEAFARAISRRMDYRGDGPLEAWLWRTVTNVARDHRRTGNLTVLVEDVPERGEPPQLLHPLESLIRDRIARLPERQRLALFLRYYVDLPYAEIAAALEIRMGTVSATLNAAHNALRVSLVAELAAHERYDEALTATT
jgi:RNA polymerase sigma-70 factor (ECF subfamily)